MFEHMKKLIFIAALFLLIVFFLPTKIYALDTVCPSLGATCMTYCPIGYTSVLNTQCSTGNGSEIGVCCKVTNPPGQTNSNSNPSQLDCAKDFAGSCRTTSQGCNTGEKSITANCGSSSFNSLVCCVPESTKITYPNATKSFQWLKLTCEGETGIDTAIGCIRVDSIEAFINSFLTWAIGIGGGVAFLLIVYSGFMIMTSSGNPEKLKAGQELLTSAIAGLIMLIFSVFILRVIGVDILKIPGIT